MLSLKIPPLREREEDILLLLHHFLREYGLQYELSREAADLLLRYDWPGNIRELQNLSAYIGCMSESRVITCAELPRHFLTGRHTLQFPRRPDPQNEDDALAHILLLLYRAAERGKHVGRRELSRQLAACGARFSEGEVRSRLQKLAAAGLVLCGKGRAGTRLTQAGEHQLREAGLL